MMSREEEAEAIAFSIAIAVENRIWTLDTLLKSLIKNSRLNNEIIVSVSSYGKAKVDPSYTESPEQEGMIFSDWLERTWGDKIRILKFDYRPGKIDVYRSWNNALRHAEHDWITYASCDCYFPPDWDITVAKFILENEVSDICVFQYVNTYPRYSSTYPHQTRPVVELYYPGDDVIYESALVNWFKNLPCDNSIKEELGGPRTKAPYSPFIIKKDLFFELGGFIEDPPHPDSHDIHFDDNLGAHGITKKICTDAFAGHGKGRRIILDI